MRKGSGKGYCVNHDGYLRITRRGPLRNKMAHRAYVERQLGRPLREDEEIHHDCRNRACWPPTDFHLVVMDKRLHDAESSTRVRYNGRKGNRKRKRTGHGKKNKR